MKARSPLKYPGGKTFIADDIVALMKATPHCHYVEPYFGGGSVFFSRPAFKWDGTNLGCSSVLNDASAHLCAFWKVMTDPKLFAKFRNNVDMLPFDQNVFEFACEKLEEIDNSAIKQALYYWIKMRMSRGGAGKCFVTPVRRRLRGQVQDHVYSYLSAVERLPEFHALLKDALITNNDGCDCIRTEDTENTLFYCDPPYLHVTRQSIDLYDIEMGPEEHASFLSTIAGIKGKAIISTYPNDMYAAYLTGWKHKDVTVKKNLSGADKKPEAVERLYFNF